MTTPEPDPKALPHLKLELGGSPLFDEVPTRFKVEIEAESGSVLKLEMGPPRVNWIEQAMSANKEQQQRPSRPKHGPGRQPPTPRVSPIREETTDGI